MVAVVKPSINSLPVFANISDECDTDPETVWHKNGKADVLFSFQSRTIAIELRRVNNGRLMRSGKSERFVPRPRCQHTNLEESVLAACERIDLVM